MRTCLWLAMILFSGMSANLFADGPASSVVSAEQVLSELMAIPARQIPNQLLSNAQGIVIVPNVLKIGFVAGARRGHGVIMVRDAEGEWSLPQFVMLTGGSVGWQAGIQSTDVVLVFTTRKGVERLMKGEFTIGVDASASAGPVGRETTAGTNANLESEIYSYSRSRGLFLGVSLDGTALQVDHASHQFYYGTPTGQLPSRVPAPAASLRHLLAELTPKAHGGPDHQLPAPGTGFNPAISPKLIEATRRSLVQSEGHLQAMLAPEWQRYLALPAEVQQPGASPTPESLAPALQRFAAVSAAPDYQHLAKRPEFQETYELLREYQKALTTSRPTLQLPPPPKQ
ncbi:MAG: lipid-binding SYLF domain-containing protein [Planctomycetes bacterium]|nr:lipid-binding SYLF domain-containing protein [Planctomycetota bacterium]